MSVFFLKPDFILAGVIALLKTAGARWLSYSYPLIITMHCLLQRTFMKCFITSTKFSLVIQPVAWSGPKFPEEPFVTNGLNTFRWKAIAGGKADTVADTGQQVVAKVPRSAVVALLTRKNLFRRRSCYYGSSLAGFHRFKYVMPSTVWYPDFSKIISMPECVGALC